MCRSRSVAIHSIPKHRKQYRRELPLSRSVDFQSIQLAVKYQKEKGENELSLDRIGSDSAANSERFE